MNVHLCGNWFVIVLKYTLFPSPMKQELDQWFLLLFSNVFPPLLWGKQWGGDLQKLAGSEWGIWWETSVLWNRLFLIIPKTVYRMKMSLAGEPIYKVKLLIKMYLAAHLVWFSKVHRKSVFALEVSSLGVWAYWIIREYYLGMNNTVFLPLLAT